MSVLKKHVENRFSKIPNQAIEDSNISSAAFRLYCYLFSRPEDWKINNADIKRKMGVKSNEAIAKYFKELTEAGWLDRQPAKTSDGRFKGGYDYMIYETPAERETQPYPEKSRIRKDAELEKSPKHTNTNSNNKTEFNTNTEKKASFPSGKLYKSAIDVYYRWYEKRFGVKPKIDGVQVSSMKKLLKNIAQISETKDDQKIIDSLLYIFEHWDYLDQFNQKQVELKNINGNLNNIVVQINQRKNNYVTDNGNFRNFLNL